MAQRNGGMQTKEESHCPTSQFIKVKCVRSRGTRLHHARGMVGQQWQRALGKERVLTCSAHEGAVGGWIAKSKGIACALWFRLALASRAWVECGLSVGLGRSASLSARAGLLRQL